MAALKVEELVTISKIFKLNDCFLDFIYYFSLINQESGSFLKLKDNEEPIYTYLFTIQN